MTDEALAVITPSLFRRGMAVGLLGALGVVLVYLALGGEEAGFGLRALFLALGTGALVLAERVWRTTAASLVLTEAGLFEDNGRLLCTSEDMAAIERGAFAFKPSNGFAIKLARPGSRAWAPGLWWRMGRRLGVGGGVSKSEAKAMADLISLRLRPPPGF